MRRAIWLGLFLAVVFVGPAFAQQWAVDLFETTTHDFGSVALGAKAEFEFRLTNGYLEDLHIAGVRSSCGCTEVRIATPTLKTYETGAIVAKVNTDAFRGNKGATITVTFDKPMYAEVQLHVSAFIRSDVLLNPGSVILGDINQGDGADQSILVAHEGSGGWEIVDVMSDNESISGEVVEVTREGNRVLYRLNVHVDEDMAPGYVNEHLMLVTNDSNSPHVPVPIEGRVLSSITVSPASLFMGVVQPGQKVRKQVVIRGTRPFRVVSIRGEGALFEFDDPSNQEAKTTHLIPVTFVAGETSGKVSGRIQIETDLGETFSELPAFAVVTTTD